MQLTRRKLAAVLTSGVALAQTPATAPTGSPASAPSGPGDLLQAARGRNKANAAALAAEPVPMATEPAFQFKV
jgi:hypothetical protein